MKGPKKDKKRRRDMDLEDVYDQVPMAEPPRETKNERRKEKKARKAAAQLEVEAAQLEIEMATPRDQPEVETADLTETNLPNSGASERPKAGSARVAKHKQKDGQDVEMAYNEEEKREKRKPERKKDEDMVT